MPACGSRTVAGASHATARRCLRPSGPVSYHYGDILDTIDALSHAGHTWRAPRRPARTTRAVTWGSTLPTVLSELIAGEPGIKITFGRQVMRLKGVDAKAFGLELVRALVAAKAASHSGTSTP
jgi:hypothetical protein